MLELGKDLGTPVLDDDRQKLSGYSHSFVYSVSALCSDSEIIKTDALIVKICEAYFLFFIQITYQESKRTKNLTNNDIIINKIFLIPIITCNRK